MSNPIEDAITALRHGDQATAFTLLRARLAREPKDATAWLWLSEATPDVHRKAAALKRFLELAPTHPHAPSVRARLQQLQSQLVTQGGQRRGGDALLDADIFGSPGQLDVSGLTSPVDVTVDRPAATPSLRDRIPAPVESEPRDTVESPSEIREPVLSDSPLPAPHFTARPAAPPPPNYKARRGEREEDDGLPGWVWVLMFLAFVLVLLFLYLILNFERFAFLWS